MKIVIIMNLPTKCPDLPLNSTGLRRPWSSQGQNPERNKDLKIGNPERNTFRRPEEHPC